MAERKRTGKFVPDPRNAFGKAFLDVQYANHVHRLHKMYSVKSIDNSPPFSWTDPRFQNISWRKRLKEKEKEKQKKKARVPDESDEEGDVEELIDVEKPNGEGSALPRLTKRFVPKLPGRPDYTRSDSQFPFKIKPPVSDDQAATPRQPISPRVRRVQRVSLESPRKTQSDTDITYGKKDDPHIYRVTRKSKLKPPPESKHLPPAPNIHEIFNAPPPQPEKKKKTGGKKKAAKKKNQLPPQTSTNNDNLSGDEPSPWDYNSGDEIDAETASWAASHNGSTVSQLHIRVESGNDFPQAEEDGVDVESEVYVRVIVDGDEKDTVVIKTDKADPKFGDEFCWSSVSPSSSVKVQLWDKDTFTRDDLVGEATFDCHSLAKQVFESRWIALSGGHECGGEIRLLLHFQKADLTVKKKEVAAWANSHIGAPTDQLHVRVDRAAELLQTDEGKQGCDAYVKLTVGKEDHETQTVSNTATPVFREDWTAHEVTKGSKLVVQVYDHDAITKDDLIGSVDISCADLAQLVTKAGWYDIKMKGKVTGKILLYLHYQKVDLSVKMGEVQEWAREHEPGIVDQLFVRVERASDLTKVEGKGGDIYTKITVGDTEFKTSVAHKTSYPAWGNDFTMRNINKLTRLRVQCFDKDKLSKDDLLGQVDISCNDIVQSVLKGQWFDLKQAGKPAGKILVYLHFVKADMEVKEEDVQAWAAPHVSGVSDQLFIRVSRGAATLLPAKKDKSNLQLYTKISVSGTTFSTKAINSVFPTFDEDFSFQGVSRNSKVKLHLYDQDRITSDDLIGQTEISCADLQKVSTKGAWFEVRGTKRVTGKVLLYLHYQKLDASVSEVEVREWVKTHESSIVDQVHVRVDRAGDMTKGNEDGLDCYVKLTVGPEEYCTKTVKNDSYPVFDEQFTISDVARTSKLRVQLFDKDRFSKDDLIGQTEISFSELPEEGGSGQWIELKGPQGSSAKLRALLHYQKADMTVKQSDVLAWAEQHRDAYVDKLYVRVDRAGDLPLTEKTVSNVYVRVTLHKKELETKAVLSTAVPVFEQEMEYVNIQPSDELKVQVFDQDRYSRDDLIGELRFDAQNIINEEVAGRWYDLTAGLGLGGSLLLFFHYKPADLNVDKTHLNDWTTNHLIGPTDQLHVRVECAALGNDHDSSDTYVKLSLEHLVKQTAIVSKNVHPVFGEDFCFEQPDAEKTMRLELFDKDRFSADELLGRADIPLGSISLDFPEGKWINITGGTSVGGRVLLYFHWQEKNLHIDETDVREWALTHESKAVSQLHVKVMRAGDLPSTESAQDVYIQVQAGAHSLSTHTIARTSNPKFESDFTLRDVKADESLKVTVYDKDRFTKDELLGHVMVPMSSIQGTSDEVDPFVGNWYDLTPAPNSQLKHAGKVLLYLQYQEADLSVDEAVINEWAADHKALVVDQLFVRVEKAVLAGIVAENNDTYATVTIGVRNRRTKTVPNDNKPVFGESFGFEGVDVDDVMIVELMDADKMSKDDSLGTCKISMADILASSSKDGVKGQWCRMTGGPSDSTKCLVYLHYQKKSIVVDQIPVQEWSKGHEPASFDQLHVRVEKAGDLPRGEDGADREGDSYVRVVLGKREPLETAAHPGSNPTFGEDFSLQDVSRSDSLLVQVMQKDTFSKDDVVGEFKVDCSTLFDTSTVTGRWKDLGSAVVKSGAVSLPGEKGKLLLYLHYQEATLAVDEDAVAEWTASHVEKLAVDALYVRVERAALAYGSKEVDSYVRLQLGGLDKSTEVQSKNTRPFFGENFRYEGVNAESKLHVSLMDQDTVTSDDVVGDFELSLADLASAGNGSNGEWHSLNETDSSKVLIYVHYVKADMAINEMEVEAWADLHQARAVDQLHVRVDRAGQLPFVDKDEEEGADVYVALSIGGKGPFKTPGVIGRNPIFKEDITIRDVHQGETLFVEVYDKNNFKKDSLIGEFTISCETLTAERPWAAGWHEVTHGLGQGGKVLLFLHYQTADLEIDESAVQEWASSHQPLPVDTLYVRVEKGALAANQSQSNTYVSVELGGKQFRSKVVSRDPKPTFGDDFKFEGAPADGILNLSAVDKDTFSKDDVLGTHSIDIASVLEQGKGGVKGQWCIMTGGSSSSTKILVYLHYQKKSLAIDQAAVQHWCQSHEARAVDQLHVRVDRGGDLPDVDGSSSATSTYVKLVLSDKVPLETKVLPGNNPSYGSEFTIRDAKPSDDLLMQVYDKDTFKDDLVGEVKIPCQDVIGAAGTTIAKWADLTGGMNKGGRVLLYLHYQPAELDVDQQVVRQWAEPHEALPVDSLHVRVERAALGTDDKRNLYVKVTCNGEGKDTKIVQNDVRPLFEEDFLFEDVTPGQTVELLALDKDHFSRDDSLGKHTITLPSDIPQDITQGQWCLMEGGGSSSTKVLVYLHYQKKSLAIDQAEVRQWAETHPARAVEQLHVRVERGGDLPSAKEKDGGELFVRVSLGDNKYDTVPQKNSSNPIFNESTTFDEVPEQGDISVQLYDKDRFTKDDLIGSAKLPFLRRSMASAQWVKLDSGGMVLVYVHYQEANLTIDQDDVDKWVARHEPEVEDQLFVRVVRASYVGVVVDKTVVHVRLGDSVQSTGKVEKSVKPFFDVQMTYNDPLSAGNVHVEVNDEGGIKSKSLGTAQLDTKGFESNNVQCRWMELEGGVAPGSKVLLYMHYVRGESGVDQSELDTWAKTHEAVSGLHVRVVEGALGHEFSEDDVYTLLEMEGSDKQKTETISNDSVPKWNQDFKFDGTPKGTLKVSVMDFDKWSSDDTLASFDVAEGDWKSGKPVGKWFSNLSTDPEDKIAVLVYLHYVQ